MLIAREKKYSNIAEYILYMYQLEDMMRACKLDGKLVDERLVSKYNADMALRAEISAWYRELIMAMKDQKIEQTGHLQYLKLQIAELSDFNYAVLQEGDDEDYTDAFKSALPALADIVQKSAGGAVTDMEAAFTLLYGVMVLRMKGQQVSEGTQEAARLVSAFMRKLVKKFHEAGNVEED